MPDLFEILKKRWPEAILVVVLQAGLFVLMMEQLANIATLPEDAALNGGGVRDFVLGLGTMAFVIVWQMLYLGFLRTAFTSGCDQHQPGELVKTGRHFFWRMIRFEFLFVVVSMALSFVILSIVSSLVFRNNAASDTAASFIMQLCFFVSMVIMVKIRLLMPAIMIVSDSMVIESFKTLSRYRILEEQRLIALFFICFAVIFLLSFTISLTNDTGFYHYALTGIYAIVSSVLMLIVALKAIMFVALWTDGKENIQDSN